MTTYQSPKDRRSLPQGGTGDDADYTVFFSENRIAEPDIFEEDRDLDDKR